MPGQLTFRVTKEFNDGNSGSVTVHLSCNTGLILDQSKVITSNTPVTFVLASIDATEAGPNCRVWEEPLAGYSASYAVPYCNESTASCTAVNSGDEPGCFYEDAHPRDGSEQNECNITNSLQPVRFTINKVWVNDGVPTNDNSSMKARIVLDCGSTAPQSDNHWYWKINGDEQITQDVYPRWQGGTVCTVSEDTIESYVESSGCDEAYPLAPGDGDVACTLTNTVFYEGIPTLNELGLAIMMLLMLGAGMITYRRVM